MFSDLPDCAKAVLLFSPVAHRVASERSYVNLLILHSSALPNDHVGRRRRLYKLLKALEGSFAR